MIAVVALTAALLSLCPPVHSDSLNVSDSLIGLKPEEPLWSDSSLQVADSLAGQAGIVEKWLAPVGIILLSGCAAILLFTTRSK